MLACRWRERAEALERALVHARRGAGPDVVSAISGLLSQALLWGPMPAPEALARCRELLDNARSDALRADVSTSLAGLLAMRGAFDDARAAFGRALAVYDEFGLQGRRAICSLIGSQIELLAGRPLEAERELRAAHAVAAGLGAPGVAATLAAVLADVVLLLDRLDEAEALTAEVEATAPDDDFFPQVLRRTVSGRLHARRGRLDEARRPIAEAVSMTDDVDFPELRVSALLAAGEVAAAEGRDAGRPEHGRPRPRRDAREGERRLRRPARRGARSSDSWSAGARGVGSADPSSEEARMSDAPKMTREELAEESRRQTLELRQQVYVGVSPQSFAGAVANAWNGAKLICEGEPMPPRLDVVMQWVEGTNPISWYKVVTIAAGH